MPRFKFLQNPVFLFFLLPLFYMIFGSVYALQYNSFHVIPFIVLYFFILLNQLLEFILKKRFDEEKFSNIVVFLIAEIALIATLTYFWIYYSWLATLFLVLYSIFIQSNVLFRIYELRFLPAILTLVMNLIFMNGFSCYTQAHFISIHALLIVTPQILPFFILTIHQWRVKLSRILLVIILLFNMGLFIYSYYSIIGYWSFIILLSLPFILPILKNQTSEAKALYAFVFGFLGIICLAIRLFI